MGSTKSGCKAEFTPGRNGLNYKYKISWGVKLKLLHCKLWQEIGNSAEIRQTQQQRSVTSDRVTASLTCAVSMTQDPVLLSQNTAEHGFNLKY